MQHLEGLHVKGKIRIQVRLSLASVGGGANRKGKPAGLDWVPAGFLFPVV